MKSGYAILINVICLVFVFNIFEGRAQLWTDFKEEPEPRVRAIRTGESLEAIRADALQTMDFGLEIMGDVLKMTSPLEHVVIFRWEETANKYFSLWRNTWDWFETTMAEKKMDLTRHKAWRKQYEDFLDKTKADGEAVLYWKWREEITRHVVQLEIRSIPRRIQELKNTVKEANDLMTEARALASKQDVSSADIDRALSRVTMAENLVEKVSREIDATQKFVQKELANKKTSLSSEIAQTRGRLKSATSDNPDIMNRWTAKVSKWADHVDEYWERYKKTWVDWEAAVRPVMTPGLLNDYSFFKDADYTRLTDVTKEAREQLQAMR